MVSGNQATSHIAGNFLCSEGEGMNGKSVDIGDSKRCLRLVAARASVYVVAGSTARKAKVVLIGLALSVSANVRSQTEADEW